MNQLGMGSAAEAPVRLNLYFLIVKPSDYIPMSTFLSEACSSIRRQPQSTCHRVHAN